MIRFVRPLVVPLLLASLSAGGCTWGVERDIPEMHRNLSKTVDIQTGVVQGDLERAREAATWLLTRQQPFPPGGESFEQELRLYASRIAEATDLKTVAVQTGQLAATCGGCHEAVRGGPSFVVAGDVPGGDSQEALMVRHLWAADRMWEGLVGPSEEAWMAGATAMAETEPALARAFRSSVIAEGAEEFLQEVNLLATEALNAYGLGLRADVYGRLLETCNRCHSSLAIQTNR